MISKFGSGSAGRLTRPCLFPEARVLPASKHFNTRSTPLWPTCAAWGNLAHVDYVGMDGDVHDFADGPSGWQHLDVTQAL